MHLLLCLVFFEAKWNFILVSTHLAGANNILADDLLRNKLHSFVQAKSGRVMEETVIPQLLVDMLCNKKPDWLSPTWREMFKSILNTVLQHQQELRSYQAGVKKFIKFCIQYQYHNPLPVSQTLLCL